MDTYIYIISLISIFILFLTGLGFSIRNIISYKYQYFLISIAICIIFFFFSYMVISYSDTEKNYPPNTNPCPDFWEIQKDGACLIGVENIGSMKKKQNSFVNSNGSIHKYEAYSKDNSPFGFLEETKLAKITNFNDHKQIDIVDFTDINWTTYGGAKSRTCALKSWANKNGIAWDGMHNYDGCDE